MSTGIFQRAAAPFKTLGAGPTQFLWFIVFNVLSWQFLIGPVLVLHARALVINTAWVGTLSALLPFAMMLSLAMKSPAQRLGSKRLLVSGWTLRNLLVTPVILTPLAYRLWGTAGAGVLLFAGVSLFCLMRALTGIGWASWLHEIVGESHRGLYYTMESVLSRGVSIIYGVAVYVLLAGHPALWKFSVTSAVGVAMGLVSIVFLRRVPGGAPVPDAAQAQRSSRDEYRQVLTAAHFRPFLGWMSAGAFVGAGQSLLLTLYMREYLAITPGLIMLVSGIANGVTMFTVHRWARIADKHGSPVAMAAAGALLAGCLLLLGAVKPWRFGLACIMLLAALVAIAESGFFVAGARGLLHRIDPAFRHAYVAVWTACTSFAAGVSFVMVGIIVRNGSHRVYFWTAVAYGLLMAVVSVAMLRLPERGVNRDDNELDLYDPAQPLLSILRICGYVLNPRPNQAQRQ